MFSKDLVICAILHCFIFCDNTSQDVIRLSISKSKKSFDKSSENSDIYGQNFKYLLDENLHMRKKLFKIPIGNIPQNYKYVNKVESKVVNGKRASRGQFPYMAYIGSCSGSILNAQTILTAAHCLCHSKKNRDLHDKTRIMPGLEETQQLNDDILRWTIQDSKTVVVGALSIYEDPKTTPSIQILPINTSAIIIHPGYPKNYCSVHPYDMAIVKLTKPILFNDNVKSVEHTCDVSRVAPNSKIINLGYGMDGERVNGYLTYGKNKLENCPSDYKRFLCSPGKPNIIFNGDSGGPMIVETASAMVQGGVNSGSYRTIDSLYTNITRSCKWIKKNL